MEKDNFFQQELSAINDFTFSNEVANVFDDMVSRSVPFYIEMQRMTAELAANHAQSGTNLFDLGCSTGTTMILMDKLVDEHVSFIGVDDSEGMIHKCREKLNSFNLRRKIDLEVADLAQIVPVENASVVTMVLVLQFIRPMHRLKLIKGIYDGLTENGVLIIVEKILTEEKSFNREYIDYYYDFKRRNNYSELEISQKREALENVLIPYKTSENITMLKEAGFSEVEVFFRWYNFSGIIAKKTP
ncbi:carboxy-S-adenosyl-L-methionine synthase CmoA [Paraflavitalea pollutisoli]|uniref:carboxy-S-adenosyl-L-methionine synthase CmoA n=1 Tax=Paraflavitalea pollutisoli TaxID=3034143 RepID=UPI0023ECC507|nr:carboxy-S-adenosyl-L-methionine synthase CmoA [Paraflavitalea sp. H1-2-19X]